MNREIKFRAWDTRENKMLLPEFQNYWLQIGLEGIIYEYSNGRLSDTTIKPIKNSYREYPYILMQYTGLKDKNGKEIYEGDIIEFEYHNGGGFSRVKEPVTFYNGQFSVWQESINNYNENCEIIGNIFENPKILNENNLL